VDHAIELLLDRFVDFGHGVTAGDRGDAAEEIEVLATGSVVDELALTAAEFDGFGIVEADTREETFLVPADEIGCIVAHGQTCV